MDGYSGYGANNVNGNDWMLMGSAVLFGMAIMVFVCCICVFIAFLAGVIGHKWYNDAAESNERGKRYRYVQNNDDIDHSQV